MVLVFSLVLLASCNTDSSPANTDPSPANTDTPSDSPTSPETSIDLSKTKPSEYVQEKLDAGMEVMIAFVAPALVDDFFIQVCDGLQADMEARGFTFHLASADYDTVKQLNLVENYVTMGCAFVGVAAMDSNAFVNIILDAEEQGIMMGFLGTIPDFYCSGACNIDIIDSATQCYNMASAWMLARYPDAAVNPVHVSVTGQTNTTDNKIRTEKLHELAEADPNMNVTNYLTGSNSVDEGFNQAEDILILDPEIRLFLNFSTSSSVGNNNYLVSNYSGRLDEFGVFSMGNNQALDELIGIARQGGESVCRGVIKQGGEKSWSGMVDVIVGLLINNYETPYFVYEHLWSETSGDFEFSYDNGL